VILNFVFDLKIHHILNFSSRIANLWAKKLVNTSALCEEGIW